MKAAEFVLLLTILRLIIPFGIIMFLGELIRRRNGKYWLKS
jgi:hypothetical protein